jgi:hypothetical protein
MKNKDADEIKEDNDNVFFAACVSAAAVDVHFFAGDLRFTVHKNTFTQ